MNHCIEIVYLNIFSELEATANLSKTIFSKKNPTTYGNFVHRYYFHNHYHHHIPMNEVYIDHHNQIVNPNIVDKLFNHKFQSFISFFTYCNCVHLTNHYNPQFDYNAMMMEYNDRLFHISIH